ncbi:ribonuclease P protein component 1 [Haloarcula japonica]|uniref:Ribonuclease P protein component 1 n=1 Tax=Haloarcula argentinensis TaxID=43776 RepID=A0ABU2F1G4_HALAR|nr:ribonuclease P protein component 1 [Haloarcula argentinensis]EMA18444.1 ribonuclease P protein component 1 [Haloarcula argentinensis DSM 12282]MDS0253995.1 ribonuclease P protein component 1 [Haloarcula argentinensis]
MPLTPETLPRHELVGLDCEVVSASNPDVVGISGTVVMETTQMLTLEGADRVWHVPKDSATFAFDLSTETVLVDGDRLVARPARRTENTGDSLWR